MTPTKVDLNEGGNKCQGTMARSLTNPERVGMKASADTNNKDRDNIIESFDCISWPLSYVSKTQVKFH